MTHLPEPGRLAAVLFLQDLENAGRRHGGDVGQGRRGKSVIGGDVGDVGDRVEVSTGLRASVTEGASKASSTISL